MIDYRDRICGNELVRPTPSHHGFTALFYSSGRFGLGQPNRPKNVRKVTWRQIRYLPAADLWEGIIAKRVDPLIDVLPIAPRRFEFSVNLASGILEGQRLGARPDFSPLGNSHVDRFLACCDQLREPLVL